MQFNKQEIPTSGEAITQEGTSLRVPNNPIIPFIEGDGIGADITSAMKVAVDAAVEKTYGGEKKIVWYEIFAGEKAKEGLGEYMPEDTFKAIKHFKVAIKGPLTTPVGGGFRSLNVTLRQVLDLYACVRPVRYYEGVPSPMKNPEKMNVVIFRENSEDVYSGIEFSKGSKEAKRIIEMFKEEFNISIREDSGLGIKPISEFGSKRLIRMAIDYAKSLKRKSVSLMHKGNIMKFTEGAFRDWGYELAKEEYNASLLDGGPWMEINGITVKDVIADNMFQQILTRTEDYDVIATMNLNGDYFSDACAAQVGGLGMAPGANIGDEAALFEATHGTAPKYAGQDKVNPGSLILSAKMMLDHIGWTKAAEELEKALEKTVKEKTVTYDLERQMKGATLLSCSEFAARIAENI